MENLGLKRRTLLQLAGAAGLAGVLPSAAIAQEVVRGGTLKAVIGGVSSLDPAFGTAPSLDRNFLNLFYDNLFFVGADGELVPALAETWSFNEAGDMLTATLRQGVSFHDGAPFDANAVKFSLERVIDPAINAAHAADLVDLESVVVVDPYTVEIHLKQQTGVILSMLATEAGMIVSPNGTPETLRRNPVGTGPFRFTEWIEGNRLAAAKNPDYWMKGADGESLPYLDAVDLQITTDATVKILAAQSGSALLTDSIQVKDFEAIAADPKLTLAPNVLAIQQWFAFNTSKPPFDNKDLRDAVLYAIDRAAIAKVITKDYGVLTPTIIVPSDWIFDGSLPIILHDPVKAQEALARSGFTGEIEISLIQRDPDLQIAQLLQAQLLQAGIRSQLKSAERQAWIDSILNKQHQIGLLQINQPRVDPHATFGPSFGRGAGFNWSAVADEKLFDLVDAARVAIDRDERKRLYVEIQKLLLDNSYYGFLFARPIADVVSKRLAGLERESSGNWRLERVWIGA